MCRSVFIASVSFLLTLPVFGAEQDVFGEFLVEDRGSKIKIFDCGDGTPCGKVTWIDPATLEDGQSVEDVTSKSGQKILGMQILSGFAKGKRDWRGGKIYSPEADKTYSSKLKRVDNNTLQVKGCIAFLCETQIWTLATTK